MLYFRSKAKMLAMVDLSVKATNDRFAYRDLVVQIKDSNAALCSQLDYDVCSNSLILFMKNDMVSIIPDLADCQSYLPGTSNFKEVFGAHNIEVLSSELKDELMPRNKNTNQQIDYLRKANLHNYLVPSDFLKNVCALDTQRNTIKVWNCGTNQFVSKTQIEPGKQSFYKWKKNSEWAGSTIMILDKATKYMLKKEMIETQRKV